MDEQRAAYVALALIPGIGPSRMHAILQACHTAIGAFSAPFALLRSIPGLSPAAASAVATGRIASGTMAIEQTERLGGRVLILEDPDYPELLSHIPEPAPVLFALGNLALLDRPAVAIVGSRDHTPYGGEVARVVRVANRATRGLLALPAGGDVLRLQARQPGSREHLRASVDYDGVGGNRDRFNLVIQRLGRPGSQLIDDQVWTVSGATPRLATRSSLLPISNRFSGSHGFGSEQGAWPLIRSCGSAPDAMAAVRITNLNADPVWRPRLVRLTWLWAKLGPPRMATTAPVFVLRLTTAASIPIVFST